MLKKIYTVPIFILALHIFIIKHKVLIFLSNISYSVYLSHLFVSSIIGIGNFLLMMLSCIVTIILSHFIYKYIEIKSIKFGKKLLNY